MKAKATAFLLADLGVTKSHSRPHTSNDNPFSESHFKTLKYQLNIPALLRLYRRRQAVLPYVLHCGMNQAHHHVSLGLMTPDQGSLWTGR